MLRGEQTQDQILISGEIQVQAGDMDVNLILNERRQLETHSKLNFESLIGKALPGITDICAVVEQIDTANKQILICFFDIQQRPSRNCVTQLAKQAEWLEEKGVTVIAVHTSNVDENTLNEWVEKNNIPFPVGMIQDDEEKTRFNWGVRSLPWLILTDRNRVVTTEGFGLDELDQKIKQAAFKNDI